MVRSLGERPIGVCASLLALLVVACGGSAEIPGGISNLGSGGTASAGFGDGVSTPGHSAGADPGTGGRPNATGGASTTGGTLGGIANGGNANGGNSSGGDAGSPEVGGDGGAAGVVGGAGGAAGSGNLRSCDRITFDDPALEAVVRRQLGKPSGEITPAEARGLTLIDGTDANISSLGGIECFGLTTALLRENPISDLQPLAALINLEHLELADAQVADLSPLAGLDKLSALVLDGVLRTLTEADLNLLAHLPSLLTLELRFDVIGSVAPLAQRPSLYDLNLSSGKILAPGELTTLTQLSMLDVSDTGVDPAPLATLSNLTYLGFELNQATNISALASLTKLQLLDLSFNQISDLSPVAQLTQLQRLAIEGNQVADLAPLRGLTQLITLNAQDNHITSLTPLVQNPGLGASTLLWLGDNPIDCQAQAANLAALSALHVGVQSNCTQP